jgi:hypothetical protein
MISLFIALAVAVQAPDTARAGRWERLLNQTTDSLDRIRGATAGFRADLENASPDLVLVRAAQVRAACAAAAPSLQVLQAQLVREEYSPRARREQAQLRSGTASLHTVLLRCKREWEPTPRPALRDADSLRAWGPYRTSQLEASLLRYLGLVRSFMKRAALKKPAVS